MRIRLNARNSSSVRFVPQVYGNPSIVTFDRQPGIVILIGSAICVGTHFTSSANNFNTQVRLFTSVGFIAARVVKADAANGLALLKAEGRFAALPGVASRAMWLAY